jgi:hypothetical protein
MVALHPRVRVRGGDELDVTLSVLPDDRGEAGGGLFALGA